MQTRQITKGAVERRRVGEGLGFKALWLKKVY